MLKRRKGGRGVIRLQAGVGVKGELKAVSLLYDFKLYSLDAD